MFIPTLKAGVMHVPSSSTGPRTSLVKGASPDGTSEPSDRTSPNNVRLTVTDRLIIIGAALLVIGVIFGGVWNITHPGPGPRTSYRTLRVCGTQYKYGAGSDLEILTSNGSQKLSSDDITIGNVKGVHTDQRTINALLVRGKTYTATLKGHSIVQLTLTRSDDTTIAACGL